MVGQAALDRAASAFVALVEARRRIVETHASLDETRMQIGLREVNAGDMPKDKPGFSPRRVGRSARSRTCGRWPKARAPLDRTGQPWSGQAVN